MAKLSNYSRAVITSAIKRSNERLREISKQLPNTFDPYTNKTVYSAIQKHEIAPFTNGVYENYLRESKTGNPAFDIRKILKDIESGELDPSEANDFLVKAAGIRFSPDGEVTQTDTGGISKMSEIVKEAKDVVKGSENMTRRELLEKYEKIVEIRDDFTFDYKDYEEKFGADNIKLLPGYDAMTKSDKSYDEMQEFHDAMLKELNKRSRRALKQGGNAPAVYPGNS